jgi:DNA-directed RNA polymerase subunit RPC12/RpoP
MSSNATWVCFECRKSVRRSKFGGAADVACPDCGQCCVNIGYKIAIPAHNARRDWTRLRNELRGRLHVATESLAQNGVRRRHRLEQQIVALESLPKNKGRIQMLRELRKQLAEMADE